MNTLANKVAIITGAGSGIGKAAAFMYAKEGAKVVVSDIQEDHGKAVAKAIQDLGGDAFFFKADTSIPSDHEALIKATLEKNGKLDIAVNTAYRFAAFAIAGVTGIFTDSIMFGVTKMLLHLSFKSTLSKFFSQLPKDTLLTKQVLWGFVIS